MAVAFCFSFWISDSFSSTSRPSWPIRLLILPYSFFSSVRTSLMRSVLRVLCFAAGSTRSSEALSATVVSMRFASSGSTEGSSSSASSSLSADEMASLTDSRATLRFVASCCVLLSISPT